MPAAAVTDIIQIHPGIWTSSRWLRTPPPPNPRPSSVGAAATDNITPLDPAVSFLQQLRPGGPWTLTAIVPDGAATTVTALTAIAATAFVREHDGRRNLYYAPNPLKKAMWKKATKKDVAGAEFVWADLDPAKGETADAAKARILMAIDAEALPPSLVVDSGNGIQALWRLDAAVLFTSSEAWEDVESRILTLTLRLGGGAGTQNVDRILRLPGTTNLPNAKKIKDGRAACPTRLLRWDNSIHPLSAFPPPVRRTEEKAKADADDNVDDAGALDLSAIDDATSARLRAAIATGSIPGRQPES